MPGLSGGLLLFLLFRILRPQGGILDFKTSVLRSKTKSFKPDMSSDNPIIRFIRHNSLDLGRVPNFFTFF